VSTLLPGLAAAGAVLVITGQVGSSAPGRAPETVPGPRPAALLNDRPILRLTHRLRVQLARVVAGVALAWLLGPLPLMIGVFAFIAVGRVRTIARQRHAQREIDRDLPEALDLFVLLLEAGVSDRSVVVEMARRGREVPGTIAGRRAGRHD
jgi:hypothetical protein